MSTRARSLFVVWLVWLVCATETVRAQTGAGAPSPATETGASSSGTTALSLAEYLAELDRVVSATSRLVNATDATPLIKSIPPAWRVHEGTQVFEISSEWIRSDLGDWQKKTSARTLERIIFRLQAQRAEAASFQAETADVSSQRDRLNKILAADEFNSVSKPSWWDRMKQRVTEWFYELFTRFISSSAIPTVSDVLVYGLIGIAVLVLGYWMYKTIRDNAGVETVMPGTLPVSSKEWSVWMAEAKAAAEAGRWRDAIHLAYWCGISFLEAKDMWPPDRARTPREYLRLLPSTSQHHPVLRALTRSFEVVWYGRQPADDQVFAETVAELEKLGCRYN